MSQQINLDKNVKIEFTPQQLTLIVNILSEGAYKQVAPVLIAIEKQVIEQLEVKAVN